MLPSFGIVAPTFHETDPPPLDLPGCDITLSQVVHGSQAIQVAAPLPTSGSATLTTRISDVWDKGKAAVIWQEGVARVSTGSTTGEGSTSGGEELWTVRSSIFVKGEGGWGGDRGTSTTVEIPDRKPDADTSYDVTPQQALLYRLCGDRNPLHADPTFAQAAGFPAPILHGLCSYGIVLRTVTDELLGGDAARVGAFTARFAGVVFPGETIRVRAWDGRRRHRGERDDRQSPRGARRRAGAGRLPGHSGLAWARPPMTDLDAWTRGEHTHAEVTHATYRRGSGPGVIVISEIPGITPKVIAFADEVVAAGFTVVMPHLFGRAGGANGALPVLRTLGAICVSRELSLLALGRTQPVADWLRSLARDLHAELGGPGVGALGMCFTGGFALAMMVDPAVAAPVLAQPSAPVALTPGRSADLNLSPDDLAAVKARAAAGCEVLGLRYRSDPMVGKRFTTLSRELGDAFVRVEFPGRQHATLTEHRQQDAVDQVLAFFDARLR